jgi:hypothetical protein
MFSKDKSMFSKTTMTNKDNKKVVEKMIENKTL